MRADEYRRVSLSRVEETRNLSRWPVDPPEPKPWEDFADDPSEAEEREMAERTAA